MLIGIEALQYIESDKGCRRKSCGKVLRFLSCFATVGLHSATEGLDDTGPNKVQKGSEPSALTRTHVNR